MPQALRIIIPPTTNQYLNLTKKFIFSSCYSISRYCFSFCWNCINANWRAIEIISITMLTYLSLSLSISVFMNWYNKKMAIKEK